MPKLEFQQIEFYQEKELVNVVFLKRYTFAFNKNEVKLKNLKITKNSISSDDNEKLLNKEVSKILNNGFENIINVVTGRKTVYIHQNSGIPLIGTNDFGIVDRNTNCIEIKPLTGCNLNCIYCSVDEGCLKDESNKKK